jgi:hypothetical protein
MKSVTPLMRTTAARRPRAWPFVAQTMKALRETLAVLAVVLAWAAVAQLADAELRAREPSAAARQA